MVELLLRSPAGSSPVPGPELALGQIVLFLTECGTGLSRQHNVFDLDPNQDVWVTKYSRFLCYEGFLCLGHCSEYLVCIITFENLKSII